MSGSEILVRDLRFSGRSARRAEDPRLLTGGGRYVDDLRLPGTLHVAVVRSPYAHGRLRTVDASRARTLPGVVAVLAPEDVDAEFPILFLPPGQRQRSYPLLPRDKVRYTGQPVAAVAAVDRYVAEDAAELVEVHCDPLPAVTDVDAALAPGAPRLYEDWPDNLVSWREVVTGDPDGEFREAAVIVEATFDLPRQTAASLEGRAALAEYDRARNELTLWVSNQAPHQFRTVLSRMLGLDEGRIRVIVPDVGGGFGAKLHYYPEEVLVCLLAMRLGRPVKWVEDRLEHFRATVHAREQRVRVRAAFDADGRLRALASHVRGDAGAHLHTKGVAPIFVTGLMLPGPYAVRHYRARIEVVVTTKVPFGAYRGFGMQQSTFVIERVMDIAARRLGIDPMEIRRRNLIPRDAFPYRSAGGFMYDSGDFPAALARAAEISRYEDLRRMQADARGTGRCVGVGLAVYVEYTAMGPSHLMGKMGNQQGGYEPAVVRVEPGGDVTVLSGVIELGQGIRATLAQLASDQLGVPLERVTVVLGDTHRAPYSAYGTAASRGAVMGGGAVLAATYRLRQKVIRLAAHLLEARPEDIELHEGWWSVRGSPGRRVSLAEIATAAYRAHDLPEGLEPGLEATYTYEPENWAFPSGVHVAAVEIDPPLGTVQFLGYWVVHDCGPLINPSLVEGQLYGGVAQGIGGALLERIVYDDHGQPLTGTFMDYLLPTACDVPVLTIAHLQTPSPTSPGGLKGMAEGGTIAAPAAVVNAIADALGGLRGDAAELVTTYPLTPDRIAALARQDVPPP